MRRRDRAGGVTAALAASTLLLTLTTTACGGGPFAGPERLSADCAVVLDGSGSGSDSDIGFRAQEKLKATLPRFLADKKCKYLSYAPITSASVASSCQVARIDIDPDADKRSEREGLWKQTRVLAEAGAEKMLECARDRQPGSDVLGGLDRAAKVPRDGGGAFQVLVISDFDQADPDFKLSKYDLVTQPERDTAVRALVSGRGLPDLPDTTVFRVGFAMRGGKTNPERVDQMEQFWQQLLEKEVKVDVDDGYGA
ncbi:hypothetical protein OG562_25695 [Streptomyces sp. NBC_01275]|uniref:hypothetical protein n=1 Tax=Streptomyces sp. NBC_01275 TaxID=2903807 RepID=UPI00224E7F9A|nr:hypothetical protein [Streptomyces sp. NBC_01275]MCX4764292.1 hypothetical protein [Streptomyces sp. NBC_01275]